MTETFASITRARQQRNAARLARENAKSPVELIAKALNSEFWPAFVVYPVCAAPLLRVQIRRSGYTADVIEAKSLRDLYRAARTAIRTIFRNEIHRRAA
jgi:hypothetical protein